MTARLEAAITCTVSTLILFGLLVLVHVQY